MAGDRERVVEAVRAALKPICDTAAEQALDAIPVARLEEVAEGRLRLGEVERGSPQGVRGTLVSDRRDSTGVNGETPGQDVVWRSAAGQDRAAGIPLQRVTG